MSSAPNNLRAYRQRLGLTQDEAAEALGKMVWDQQHKQAGVDASAISKWERGEKRPRRYYRDLLCALYGADEYQLALRPQPAPAHSPRIDWSVQDLERQPSDLGYAQLGDDGRFAESAVNRREFLAGAAALISSTALPRSVLGLTAPTGLSTEESLAGQSVGLDVLSEYLGEMWHALVRADNMLGPKYALGGVLDNIGVVNARLHGLQGTDAQRLLGLGAKFAESAAWLYEDLGELDHANSWLDRAHGWASRAGDESMTTWALVGRARQALQRGDARACLPLAEAVESTGLAGSPAMRAAALCYDAEAHAVIGDESACLRALDRAESLAGEVEYDQRGDAVAGGHGSFCTPNYVAAQRGRCWLRLGKPERALPFYLAGLHDQPTIYQRDRGWSLAGLASVQQALGDPERAASTAYEALQIGMSTGSARTVGEVLRGVPELPSSSRLPDTDYLRSALRQHF